MDEWKWVSSGLRVLLNALRHCCDHRLLTICRRRRYCGNCRPMTGCYLRCSSYCRKTGMMNGTGC